MIIARIESLILERGMEDALTRAFAYVEAGADGIMIHSRKKTADEIIEFCDKFRQNILIYRLLLFQHLIIILRRQNWRLMV